MSLLNELPAAPAGRSGWPWTEEGSSFPATAPNGGPWPKISVITPSFNQASFLEETLRSVLLQGYPNLELIVFDGGSTDRSVEVIQKYERHIAYWISEKDRGQAHAINKGFAQSTGDILAWLNSDDTYLPGALRWAAELFTTPETFWVAGAVLLFQEGRDRNEKLLVQEPAKELLDWVVRQAGIHQPGVFWRRQIYQEIGGVSERFHCCFDYEYWCRMAARGYRPLCSDQPVASYRLHDQSKTCSQWTTFLRENERIAENFRSSFGPEENRRIDAFATETRFQVAKVSAELLCRDGRGFDALRTLLAAVWDRPQILTRETIYLKFLQALARAPLQLGRAARPIAPAAASAS